MGHQTSRPQEGEPQGWALYDEMTVQAVLDQIRFCIAHAVRNAGCSGDAVIALEFHSALPVQLRVGGNAFDDFHEPPSLTSVRRQTHTVALADGLSLRGQAVIGHLLLTDLFQAFGRPELPYIAANGAYRVQHFSRDTQRTLQGWTPEVELTDERIG